MKVYNVYVYNVQAVENMRYDVVDEFLADKIAVDHDTNDLILDELQADRFVKLDRVNEFMIEASDSRDGRPIFRLERTDKV